MLRADIILLLGLAPAVLSQSIVDFSQLPACAATCYDITTAQSLCLPPKAPVSTQQTYDTCFCNSNFLANFATNAAAICDPPCTDANDRAAIQTWFNGFCKNGAATGAATTSTNTAAATTSTGTLPASTADSAASSASTGTVNRSWWDIHARWVAMAIVLIIGFSLITVAGVLWKRRYNRKRNLAGASSNGAFWGPSTNQHVNDSVERFGNRPEKPPTSTAQQKPKKLGKFKNLIGR